MQHWHHGILALRIGFGTVIAAKIPREMSDDLVQGFEMRVGDVMAKARFQSISTTESLLANPHLPA